jgi:dissimilatory sulfite reductase (desulfoviridin) alpha/beta subunit
MAQSKVNVDELRRGGIVALLEPNKYSIWVKTACCNLNSKQIRKLADITDKYGRGFLLFTSRQIPIIPHVDISDVADVKGELAEVDMELDRCGSRVRNLNVCYEDKVCPQARVNCLALGEKLEKFFGSEIMHKVKIGVSGCAQDCVITRALTDIGFVGDSQNGIDSYTAYVGGRLGLNSSLGVKIAGNLSEDQSVQLVQNYFDLLKHEGKQGDRASDLVKRLGVENFTQKVCRGIEKAADQPSISCPNKMAADLTHKTILQIRAACGEVTSEQLRKIASVAEKFAIGIIHFSVRGAPEIPGADNIRLPEIKQELAQAGLELIENGVDNIQSCFGGYCGEGLADPQALLKKLDGRVKSAEFSDLKLTLSGSGCPNSCGIAHLSDIGFHGEVEPEVDPAACNGCGLCLTVCKRKAIEIKSEKAVIDLGKCGNCGQCVSLCPLSAVKEKRKGFAVLLGGRGGADTRLGVKIAEYATEDQALAVAEHFLSLVKANGGNAGETIDKLGIENIARKITH